VSLSWDKSEQGQSVIGGRGCRGFRFVRLAFAVDVKWAFDGAKKKERYSRRRNMGWCFLVKCKEGNENVRRTIRKVCVWVKFIWEVRRQRDFIGKRRLSNTGKNCIMASILSANHSTVRSQRSRPSRNSYSRVHHTKSINRLQHPTASTLSK